MHFLLIYFSGTGNTKRVVDTIEENLIRFNHTLEVVDALTNDIKDINNYDGLIVSYPIYGFNAPKPIIQYVKKLVKPNKTTPCLIMKNSGENLFWNNASSLYLISLLKRRNIRTTNEYHYLMPYSFVFRHSDFMAFRMNEMMKGLIPLDLKDFLDKKEVHLKRFFLDRLFAFMFRIQWLGGRLNGRFYKVEKDKCIQCLKCVNTCPVNNICYENGKFKFKGQCLMCQRCIMYCPKQAIKVGLFNHWRVDQPYSFQKTEYQKEKKPHFCQKSYQKYFDIGSKKIENNIINN